MFDFILGWFLSDLLNKKPQVVIVNEKGEMVETKKKQAEDGCFTWLFKSIFKTVFWFIVIGLIICFTLRACEDTIKPIKKTPHRAIHKSY